MEHFSHGHPLIFNEEYDGSKILCHGCGIPISGPFYSCDQCPYVLLHKLCAELPNKMKHPMHPQHPLSLLAHPPSLVGDLPCVCHSCDRLCVRFTYHCSFCDFVLDVICASMAHRIKHEYHHHPFIPLQEPASFLCHGCGTEHRGVSYKCSSCNFWVHQRCTLIPSTIEHGGHVHLLKLAHSLPDDFFSFITFCDVCKKRLNRMHWFYCCVGCRYFAHVNCARESLGDKKTGIEDEVLDPSPILLPEPNGSVDLLTLFVKKTSLEESKIATKFDHFGHHHPLILVDVQIKDESLTNGVIKNCKLCEACVQPISAPFYSCTHCNYFLHKCCAELPKQIRHPCHPEHPLDLLAKAEEDFGLIRCSCCEKPCNGFSFKCIQCKDLYLDVKCGSLTGAVKHKAHNHLLIPKIISSANCTACVANFSGLAFACGICNFILHTRCAILPAVVKHRYDKHPLILTYSPIEDHMDEYYCELCEEQVNPKLWFYHCGVCDQSIHSECIYEYVLDSNIKYGASFEVEGHPHLLTFARFTKEFYPPCNHCGRRLKGDHYASGFECAACKFWLHLECARGVANKETS